MEYSLPLISILAPASGLAFVFGLLAGQFRIPALVGRPPAGIAATRMPGPAAGMIICGSCAVGAPLMDAALEYCRVGKKAEGYGIQAPFAPA